MFRCHDEIAFIFSILIIDHYDDFTAPYGINRIFYRCQGRVGIS